MILMEVKGLGKTFGTKKVLNAVNLSLKTHQTIALVGPNGAGKSTLLELLTANLDPSEGEIRFKGELLKQESSYLRRRIGYLPQKPLLPPWVNARELLSYAQSLHELKDPTLIEKTLAHWDITSFAHQAVANCSHGMQKRIGLAVASIHDPDLLILDEPFAGLDILHTRALVELITIRKKNAKATLLSCHITPYIARLCETVYIIRQGTAIELMEYPPLDINARIELIEKQF